jgi:membrane protein DedA with SNARE-associated domain
VSGVTAAVGDTVTQVIEQLGYAGLVAIMALEHVFPPIPSELVLPLAGFEVGRGNLNFVGALLAATAGSLAGASLLYAAARAGGRPLILRHHRILRLSEDELDRAERRFERHSVWIVVLGRMVPGIRSAVSVPPGLLRMPFRRYLALTLVGSLAWNALLIFAGQQLGSRWDEVGHVVDPIARWTLAACVPLAIGWLVWRRVRSADDRRPPG